MIGTWVKSMVMFALFSSMVFYLLPDESYRKYLQTAVGCVMAVLVIAPVIQAEGISDSLTFEYYREQEQTAVSEDDKQYYTDVMEEMVETYIEETWNVQARAALTFDESYAICRMDVSVQEEAGEKLLEDIRQGLISGYEVSEDTVSVTAGIWETQS